LNGVEIARDRAPDGDVPWDARATRSHSDRQAVDFENFLVSEHVDKLRVGENVLAIHGLFRQSGDSDMLILPSLGSGVVLGSQGEVPLAQIGNPKIDFGMIDNQPTSTNQDEEFIELKNNNSFSVDISGWTIESGDVKKTFIGGTVIPAGDSMYIAANKPAFKLRADGPTGGQQLFVIGNYDGRLSNTGGAISLTAPDGEVVSTAEFTGVVSNVQDALRITEINYNPLNPTAAELSQNVALDAEDFEFVEVENISDTAVDLTGVRFTNGIEFDFTGSAIQSLAPGERAVVVKDLAAFTMRYGTTAASRVAGEFVPGTGLGNNGERIVLLDTGNSEIVNFRYETDTDTGWPSRADGNGSSLVLRDTSADPSDGLNWSASLRIGGTPGAAADSTASLPAIVINEVLANSADPATDTVELLNVSGSSLKLEHAYLSDRANSLGQFAIPTTTIAANNYLLLDESDFNVEGNGFAFSSASGETIYLTVGDASGPTHFLDVVSFGATSEGETYGRINGTSYFAPMAEATLGQFNSAPRIGPVIISEVQRDAGLPSAAALAIYPQLDGGDLEFIEIYNPQATDVDLTNWRIRGGVDMTFADQQMIGAGQTLVVVSFAAEREDNAARTAAFRTHYGLADDAKIVGGYANQLNNDRDRITLQRPGTAADDGSIPRLLEDEIVYSNVGTWIAEEGNSLNRVSLDTYGNDGSNWMSKAPTPGAVMFMSADVNNDGSVTADDIEVVCSAISNQDMMEFDYTRDGQLSFSDLEYFVRMVVGTSFGDANVDGVFNSSDLTLVFQAGQYEDSVAGNSTWATGDWNCDGEFTTSDFVTAFMYGEYSIGEATPRIVTDRSLVSAAVAPVASANQVGPDAVNDRIDAESVVRPELELEQHSVDSVFAEIDLDVDDQNDRTAFDDDDWRTPLI
ncbi:MAG: lamin tail domain-containing protein, partial [Planctomycetales bacterium]|nr:lamin tail domain-containing protein [Planctomycetales bacterium]